MSTSHDQVTNVARTAILVLKWREISFNNESSLIIHGLEGEMHGTSSILKLPVNSYGFATEISTKSLMCRNRLKLDKHDLVVMSQVLPRLVFLFHFVLY